MEWDLKLLILTFNLSLVSINASKFNNQNE